MSWSGCRTRWAAGATLGGAIVALAACARPTVPVLEPPPPGPQPPPPVKPIDLGRFPESPPPRWGVAVFALPREEEPSSRLSLEWTTRVQSRLEWNGVAAVPVQVDDAMLEGELEEAAAMLAARPESREIDLLLTGGIGTGGGARVHLLAVDARTARIAARIDREARNIDTLLDAAVREAIRSATIYWVELHRGEDVAAEVTVRGLASDAEVHACHEALAAVADVHVARRLETRVAGDTRTAVFTLFFHGEPARLSDRLATTRWLGPRGPMRFERRGDFELEARRGEDPTERG